jgi:polysaccharide biosynthesis protein PslH
VRIPAEYSVIRRLGDHLRSVASRRPYTYYTYRADDFEQQLGSILHGRTPDLVHLDSVDLAGYLDSLPPVPITCTHHDVESELLERKAQQLKHRVLREYVRHQSKLVERVEREVTPRFDLNLMMSALDADRLTSRATGARTMIVPNGVDTDYFVPGDGVDTVAGRIVFVGPTFMFANRDAVDFFLSSVWDRVRSSCPGATLELIGRNAPEEQTRYAQYPGVLPAGFVPDVRPRLQQAACSVVPIRIGGGTRIKILESWAMGVPVVSTEIGCEGLHAVDGENILIRDTPEEMADAVIELLRDARLRHRLREECLRTVGQSYSWTRIGADLRAAYRSLLQPNRLHESDCPGTVSSP